jgi:hypothetical protein
VEPVVLVGADAELLARVRRRQQVYRRVAIMVGEPDDPEVRAAAVAMAGELFGPGGAVEAVDGRSADASRADGAAGQ